MSRKNESWHRGRQTRVDVTVAGEERESSSMEAALHQVLRYLETNGPVVLAEIPRSWPVTRLHLKLAVKELVARGLVEEDWPVRVPRRPTLVLTDRGRAALAERRRAAQAA